MKNTVAYYSIMIMLGLHPACEINQNCIGVSQMQKTVLKCECSECNKRYISRRFNTVKRRLSGNQDSKPRKIFMMDQYQI